jgi:hypothetical protein
MFRFAVIGLSLAVSCGPKTLATNPPPAESSDEPWVKEHRELARAGCECESSSCLKEHKTKIAALEAEHGGLDESPADVHHAHGEFEECYRAGTRDPARDLEVIVRRMCSCSDEACVKQTMIARLQFGDKYGGTDVSGELAKLDVDYNRCKEERITSGDELADHYESVMAAVCSCATGKSCGTQLTDLPPMPSAVMITELRAHEHRIEQATERACTCAQNAGLLGTYGGFAVTRRCRPPAKE